MSTLITIESIDHLRQLVLNGFDDWELLGHVSVKHYGDLLLFNYKPEAQYEGRWNWFERVSRGLIIRKSNGEVLARPFDKFFNWGEGDRYGTGHITEVTEKLDGSLGILYRHKGLYHVATRGSLDGEQAKWATDFLRRNYDLSDLPNPITLLFEIIYPENRVVVDYGDREDLVLIGARDRYTGKDYPFSEVRAMADLWGFSLPKIYDFATVDDVIAEAEKLDYNAEGWVVRFDDGERFKVKGDAYREIHRLLTGLSFRRVLEAMRDGVIDQLIDSVPDEFLDDVRRWEADILNTVSDAIVRIDTAFKNAPKDDRKTFALWVKEHHPKDAPYLFAMLDGRDIRPLIYKREFDGRRSA